jgi:hypothetical protein
MIQLMAMLTVIYAILIPAPQAPVAVDASAVKVGAPATITELDLGKLKGELRQLGWSIDGTELYVQTADGNPNSEKLRHYVVAVAGGAVKQVDAPPQWAVDYWTIKSDRFAPGLRSVMIEVQQKQEKIKVGTGSGRPGEQAGGSPGSTPVDIEKTAEGQWESMARLTVFGETVSEFVNQMPIPGLMFSWGPPGSGTIAFTDRELGRLTLLDRNKHKQTVSGVKDALLPAWSTDGTRLAWVQKAGRRKYTLVSATVSMKG